MLSHNRRICSRGCQCRHIVRRGLSANSAWYILAIGAVTNREVAIERCGVRIAVLDAIISHVICKLFNDDILVTFRRHSMLISPPTIRDSHSKDCRNESKPTILGYPSLIKSQFILPDLVMRVNNIAVLEIPGNNIRSRNSSLGHITMGIRESSNVRIARFRRACVLGSKEDKYFTGRVLIG
jgi:hypothetical protein